MIGKEFLKRHLNPPITKGCFQNIQLTNILKTVSGPGGRLSPQAQDGHLIQVGNPENKSKPS